MDTPQAMALWFVVDNPRLLPITGTGARWRASGRLGRRRATTLGECSPVRPPPPPRGAGAPPRLRQAILDDNLSPGQHLREEEISEMLDVSRGPVRDAFLMLQREGLVKLSRHRGATVVKLSTEDIGEVYSLRSAIESLAVRLAIRRHRPADLDALADSITDLQRGIKAKNTDSSLAMLDLNFHDGIFGAAHHGRLSESWANIRMQVYWCMLSRSAAAPDWRVSMVERHEKILTLITSNDELGAADAIAEHVSGAYNRICANLADTDSRPSHGPTLREIAETFLLS
jgi:DNA-binding GntR family transcriptional regulator